MWRCHFFLVSIMCMCVCVHEFSAQGSQKSVLDPLVVSCLTGMLGIQSRSSAKAVGS